VTIEVLKGFVYHTTPRGDDTPDINWDGEIHALSGLLEGGDQDVLRIGFEDLPNLGDADFEDVLFDLDIDRVHIDASEVGDDILIGGGGNDILYGEAGDDVLVIGDGFDQATGGSGADLFVFDVFDGLADKILDFNSAEGDVLNISDILSGYDPLTDALTDFVQLVQNGGDTELHVDADGAAGGVNFTALAIFDGGIADTLGDLINNGNLVADSPVVL
jgi:Ca2+-binding RTX toxin-like protein